MNSDNYEKTPNVVQNLQPIMHGESEISDSENSGTVEFESGNMHVVPVLPENEHVEQDNVFDQNVEHDLPNVDDLSAYQLARDRPRREIRKPQHLDDYASIVFNVYEQLDGNEPKSYKKALKCDKSVEWINAMRDEMNSLHVNQTWTFVPKNVNFSLIYCKWLFKLKHEIDSVCFKARLVDKGFT